jgi:hypothetical protein
LDYKRVIPTNHKKITVMKKVVIAAFTLVTLGAVSANAQTTTPATQTAPATQTTPPAQSESTTTTPAEDKTPVKVDELPEPVKATLASASLKDWTATEAFLVKGTEGKEYYAINVKKGEETGSIQLDKEGKPVK